MKKPVKWWIIGLMCGILSGCGRQMREVREIEARQGPVSQPLHWLRYRSDRAPRMGAAKLPAEFAFDQEKSRIALGFGLERPQKIDLGVYGKVGARTVFIASSRAIADYDRLYWPMVRILSEKYGCFMKRKSSSRHMVRIECKDSRTIVFERDISDGYAKFSGRQFDRYGNEIIIKPKVMAAGL